MAKHPWFKFFPADWRADASLRMCSPAARLLWLEMLCLMHEADPRGHLLVKGRRPTDIQLGMLAGLTGGSTGGSVSELIAELREAEVFDEIGGVIVSRKMVKDTKVSEEQADRRTKGWERARSGNTGGSNPVEPKKPEARSQIEDAAAAAREVADWPAGKAFDHARLLVAEAETPNLNIERTPGLAQTITFIHRWMKAGASWEHDVVPVVLALAKKSRSPVTSWKYFDTAVLENIAATKAALTIPEHNDVHRPDPRRPDNGHDSRKLGALAFLAEGEDQRDDPAG